MAWIESHQELARHPKTKRLGRALGICLPQAVGHLHFLWWWALDYAEDGSLAGYSNEDIAEAAGWEGDAAEFVQAMLDCGVGGGHGFLAHGDSGHLEIHDWEEYAGRLLKQRRANVQRTQRWREANADVTHNERITNAQATPLPYPTVPNQPNQPGSTSGASAPAADAAASKPPKVRKAPEHAEQFKALIEECGSDADHLTDACRGELNKAAADLDRAHFGPAEIHRTAEEMRQRKFPSVTPSGIAKWAPTYGRRAPPNDPYSSDRPTMTPDEYDAWLIKSGRVRA